MHLESISNGLGAQSMCLILMVGDGTLKATQSITADTGWESDRTWSNGRKGSSKEYFEEIVAPLCAKIGMGASFVRSTFKDGTNMPALIDHVRKAAESGDLKMAQNIPLFGSKGGRLRQTCTDKWKIRAMRQEARRLGATTNRGAQGIHWDEADRRVKGKYIGMDGPWSIYQSTITRKKVELPVKWCTHYYPLVDLRMNRNAAQRRVVESGIPYLLSSECDGCPHKDWSRWKRTDPGVIKDLAELEAMFKGHFFFTDQRIPLLEALKVMERKAAGKPESEADFGCRNDVCGI